MVWLPKFEKMKASGWHLKVEFPYPLSWKILKTPWREGLINFTLSLSPLSFSCGIRDGFQGTVQHASANSPSHCHAGVIKRRRGYLWHWEQERGERQQGLPWSRRQRPLFNSSLVLSMGLELPWVPYEIFHRSRQPLTSSNANCS